jgi:hypothetical protein
LFHGAGVCSDGLVGRNAVSQVALDRERRIAAEESEGAPSRSEKHRHPLTLLCVR